MVKLKRLFFIAAFILFAVIAKAQIKFGYNAPEVALPTISGDTIRLSSLKGKVVLLDFWASWCGPCRYSNKDLVKIYSKFREKGFEILGVSIDDNQKEWQSAIKKDKITWLQVNDRGGWDAPTVSKWNINAIPTSYLIDKNGTLIAMDLHGKELAKALKDILGD